MSGNLFIYCLKEIHHDSMEVTSTTTVQATRWLWYGDFKWKTNIYIKAELLFIKKTLNHDKRKITFRKSLQTPGFFEGLLCVGILDFLCFGELSYHWNAPCFFGLYRFTIGMVLSWTVLQFRYNFTMWNGNYRAWRYSVLKKWCSFENVILKDVSDIVPIDVWLLHHFNKFKHS